MESTKEKIKECLLISIRYISHNPKVFVFYLSISATITFLVVNFHTNEFTVGTRILVEDTSKYASILSGHYTPRSNIKERIESLKEHCLSKESIKESIRDAKISENWDTNKPKLYAIKGEIFKLLGRRTSDDDKENRLIAFVRKKISFYRDNNTIVLHFSWHNAEEAQLLIESLQSQIIQKNSFDQKNKSRKTIEVLQSIKSEIDSSINKLSSQVSKIYSNTSIKINEKNEKQLKLLQEKRDQLTYIQEKITSYERRTDEIKIDAEQTISKLRRTLGPKHPDLKLAMQATDKKLNRSGFLGNLLSTRSSLLNEISRLESSLHLRKISADSNAESSKAENLLNEIQLLSLRRQDLEQRIDDAKKSLLSIDTLLTNTLTVTDPPVKPKKPSSKTTYQASLITFILSILSTIAACFLHGFMCDTILSSSLVHTRHSIRIM